MFVERNIEATRFAYGLDESSVRSRSSSTTSPGLTGTDVEAYARRPGQRARRRPQPGQRGGHPDRGRAPVLRVHPRASTSTATRSPARPGRWCWPCAELNEEPGRRLLGAPARHLHPRQRGGHGRGLRRGPGPGRVPGPRLPGQRARRGQRIDGRGSRSSSTSPGSTSARTSGATPSSTPSPLRDRLPDPGQRLGGVPLQRYRVVSPWARPCYGASPSRCGSVSRIRCCPSNVLGGQPGHLQPGHPGPGRACWPPSCASTTTPTRSWPRAWDLRGSSTATPPPPTSPTPSRCGPVPVARWAAATTTSATRSRPWSTPTTARSSST